MRARIQSHSRLPDGRYLVVRPSTGEPSRIEAASGKVERIDPGGETLTLRDRAPCVLRNQREAIVPVRRSGTLLSGEP